jgi:hypothetical protein
VHLLAKKSFELIKMHGKTTIKVKKALLHKLKNKTETREFLCFLSGENEVSVLL